MLSDDRRGQRERDQRGHQRHGAHDLPASLGQPAISSAPPSGMKIVSRRSQVHRVAV